MTALVLSSSFFSFTYFAFCVLFKCQRSESRFIEVRAFSIENKFMAIIINIKLEFLIKIPRIHPL